MQTVTLRIDNSIYQQVMAALGKFKQEQLQVIENNPDFEANRRYIAGEIARMDSGNAKFISIEEAEARMDAILRKHETRS